MSKCLTACYIFRNFIETFIVAGKTVLDLSLGIESFDDAQASERFFYIAHDYAPLVLALQRFPFQLFTDAAHDRAGNWQQNQYKNRKLPADGNHHTETHENHDGILEEHVERRHYGVLHLGHVSAHACYDITLAFGSEKTYRKLDNLAIHGITYIPHYTHAHRYDHIRCHVGSSYF